MTDINLKTLTPDTSLPTTGFLFGADSQASTNPSVYSTQTVATTLLGSTSLTGDTLTADAPVLNLAQTWNNGAVTFTGIKYNATSTASAAASLLMDLQVGGTSQFKVRKDGFLFVTNSIGMGDGVNSGINAGAFTISGANNAYINIGSSGFFKFVTAGSTESMSIVYQGPQVSSTGFYAFTSSSNTQGTADTTITRKAAANLRFGAADAASPVAQTLSVQSIVGGISTDASAAAYPFKITGAQGTGQGAGGSIIFQTAPAAVSSGNGQNGLTDTLTLDSVGSVRVVRALIVANLPGTPLAGMIARVSDASAPVIGTTVAGGGAAYALVNYNGANWTVIGV